MYCLLASYYLVNRIYLLSDNCALKIEPLIQTNPIKNSNLTVCQSTQNKYSPTPFNDNEIKRVLVGLIFPSKFFFLNGFITVYYKTRHN